MAVPNRWRATPLLRQVRNNAIALLSLLFAVTTLGYTTWRNEATEYNRNVRTAGFEILIQLAELQLVTDYAHYERDPDRGNPITGWTHVLVVRDLSSIMPEPVPARAVELFEAWQGNWGGLGGERASVDRITAANRAMRDATVDTLAKLR